MGQGSSYPRLVGDVGGTNARFAWIEAPGARPSRIASYGGAEHASIAQAIQHYLAAHALARPAWASIGIATAVTGDEVRMTNHPWTFSIARLQLELELERLLVINDFTALALSLPALDARQCRQIGGGRAVPGRRSRCSAPAPDSACRA